MRESLTLVSKYLARSRRPFRIMMFTHSVIDIQRHFISWLSWLASGLLSNMPNHIVYNWHGTVFNSTYNCDFPREELYPHCWPFSQWTQHKHRGPAMRGFVYVWPFRVHDVWGLIPGIKSNCTNSRVVFPISCWWQGHYHSTSQPNILQAFPYFKLISFITAGEW